MSYNSNVLLIYTGGTIGMSRNPLTGALEPLNFEHLLKNVPELEQFSTQIATYQFNPPIDSSDMSPTLWTDIAHIIADNYNVYDGFVVLHGTDTMAYTASALSYMLENLTKPVILTGSQLPIGQLRTDGKENLLTSIEIAAARNAKGEPMVPEVCIFFKSRLMRGNRTTKINAEGFNAFRSYNYPSLAHAGIHLKYDEHLIRRPAPQAPFKPHYLLDNNVLILTLFPGIRQEIVDTMTAVPNINAIILKTYGSGNAPQKAWLVERIRKIVDKGVIVVNITQCSQGTVEMRRYGTGLQLLQAGVINGYDSTVESMVTKLMFLLGHRYSHEHIKELMQTSIAGEITLTE